MFHVRSFKSLLDALLAICLSTPTSSSGFPLERAQFSWVQVDFFAFDGAPIDALHTVWRRIKCSGEK